MSHQLLFVVLLTCTVPAQGRGDDPAEFFRGLFPDAISALAFSPDGQVVASGGHDETLRLWNPATGKETFKIVAHKKGVKAVVFSPDGKWILSGGHDKTIRLWDLTGKEIGALEGHDGAVTSLLFSPDGKELISGSADKTVRFWNLAERKEVRKFTAHGSGVQALGLTSDNLLVTTGQKTSVYPTGGGGTLTSTGPDKPRLWNLANTKEMRSYDIEASLAILSFDRRFLATSGVETSIKPGQFSSKTISALRDAATGKILIDFKQGAPAAFSPDGKILAVWGLTPNLRLFETITGQEIHAVPAAPGGTLAFSADGKRLASGELGKTKFPGANKSEPGARVRFLDIPPQPEKWARLAKDADLADLWEKLANKDSAAAYQALWTLAAVPEKAVPMFKDRLKLPPAGPDPVKLRKLIADLDSNNFQLRQSASKELQKLGHGAEFPLREALDSGKLPAEARGRVQELLSALELSFPCQGEALRDARSLQALDLMGTPEALTLIRTLADGPPTSLMTQDAQRILQRRKK